MTRENLVARMRAAVAARVASAPGQLRELSAPALLGVLAASALAPVLAASTPAAVLAAGVGVVGSVGANILTDVIKDAVGLLDTPVEPAAEPPEPLVLAVADRIRAAFAGGDPADDQLRAHVVGLLRAVDVAGTALQAAADTGNDELVRALAAEFARFGAMFDECAFLLADVQASLESMHRELRREVGRQSIDRERARRTEAGVRQILETVRDLALTRQAVPDAATPLWDGCPYRGLLPFEQADSTVFFGRRKVTSGLLRRIAEHLTAGDGLLLVLGPSGAGKSSLLRAGLLAALAEDRLVPGSRTWPACVVTPTRDPLQQLAACLADLAGLDAITVHDRLSAHPERAHLIAAQILAARVTGSPAGDQEPARLILVVDQLEELFTLTADPGRRSAFLAALNAMASRPVLPDDRPAAVVVAGIRGDFLDQATTFAPVRRAVEAGPFAVGAMSESDLKEVITGPAACAGVPVAADLVTTLLDDLRDRNLPVGYASGVLPLLSQVLFEMWQVSPGHRLTVGTYRDTGGVATIVHTSAERVWDTLTAAQRDIAWRMFLHLASADDDGRLIRRAATRAAIRTAAGGDDHDLDVVLEVFTSRRLITRTGKDLVEIAHEELLHSWDRLRGWLQPSATDRALRHALVEDVQQWQERGRDTSYLYRGGKLLAVTDAADRWAKDPDQRLALDAATTDFLHAGRRRGRRRRRVYQVVTAAMALLLILTGTAAAFAKRSATNARQNAAGAERQHRLALSRQFAALSRAATDDRAQAERLAAAGLRVADTEEARAAAGDLLADHRNTLPARGGAVSFSPDGRLVATAFGPAALWNADTGQAMGMLDGARSVETVRFSPDGKLLATGDFDGEVRLWDPITRRAVGPPLPGRPGQLLALRFSPDGKLLAASDLDGTVRLWDPATGRTRGTITTGATVSLAAVLVFSPDGTLLATSGDGTAVQVWDPVTGRLAARLRVGKNNSLTTFRFSPDGTRIAAITGGEVPLRIWDTATGRPVATDPARGLGLSSVAFSPDGKMLATGADDGTVRLWEPATGRSAGSPLRTGKDRVSAVAFSPDGKTLATAADPAGARLWRLATRRPIGPALTGHKDAVLGLTFSPDGRLLATAGAYRDNSVRLWDAVTGRPAGSFLPDNLTLMETAFSPTGDLIAAAGDGVVDVWDAATGRRQRHSPGGGADFVTPVAFNPDGRLVATADERGVRLWDPITGKPGAALQGTAMTFMSVTFSPSGQRLAAIGDDGSTHLWDLSDGTAIATTAAGHPARTSVLSFSRDGKLLAAGREDGTVQLWNPGAGRAAGPPLKGTGESVSTLAFSPDGKLLAVATMGPVRLWHTATGAPAGTLDIGADDQPLDVLFSADGRVITTINSFGVLQRWDPSTTTLINTPGIDRDGQVFAMALAPDGKVLATGGGYKGTVTLRGSADAQAIGAPLPADGDGVSDIAYSPDGKFLLTINNDGKTRLSDVATFLDPLRSLCGRVGSLSEDAWDLYAPGEPYVEVCAG